MGLIDSLRGAGSSGETLYECRNCGTSVGAEADRCPECASTEIARYSV